MEAPPNKVIKFFTCCRMEFFVFTYSIVLISIKSLHNTANFLNLDLETYLSTNVTSNFRLGGNSIGVRIRGNLFSMICF